MLLQLLLAFPIAYSLYAVTASSTLTIIQFLAPFVILGIGLDDVFVFVGIYRSLLLYADSFDTATRLQVCCSSNPGSMALHIFTFHEMLRFSVRNDFVET